MARVNMRWMLRRDVQETTPWLGLEEGEILELLRSRMAIALVAERADGSLAGAMIYQLHRDHLEILHLGVDTSIPSLEARKEVAGKMISHLASKLSQHRRTHLIIDVPESSLPLLQFLRSQGFKALGLNRGQYDEEDGITMEYRLPAAVLSEV